MTIFKRRKILKSKFFVRAIAYLSIATALFYKGGGGEIELRVLLAHGHTISSPTEEFWENSDELLIFFFSLIQNLL